MRAPPGQPRPRLARLPCPQSGGGVCVTRSTQPSHALRTLRRSPGWRAPDLGAKALGGHPGKWPAPCSQLTSLLKGTQSQSRGEGEASAGDPAVCRRCARRQAGWATDGGHRLAGRRCFVPPACRLRGPSASEGGILGPWPGLGAGRGGDSSLGRHWNPPASPPMWKPGRLAGAAAVPVLAHSGPSCCPPTAVAPWGFRGDMVVTGRGSPLQPGLATSRA